MDPEAREEHGRSRESTTSHGVCKHHWRMRCSGGGAPAGPLVKYCVAHLYACEKTCPSSGAPDPAAKQSMHRLTCAHEAHSIRTLVIVRLHTAHSIEAAMVCNANKWKACTALQHSCIRNQAATIYDSGDKWVRMQYSERNWPHYFHFNLQSDSFHVDELGFHDLCSCHTSPNASANPRSLCELHIQLGIQLFARWNF